MKRSRSEDTIMKSTASEPRAIPYLRSEPLVVKAPASGSRTTVTAGARWRPMIRYFSAKPIAIITVSGKATATITAIRSRFPAPSNQDFTPTNQAAAMIKAAGPTSQSEETSAQGSSRSTSRSGPSP